MLLIYLSTNQERLAHHIGALVKRSISPINARLAVYFINISKRELFMTKHIRQELLNELKALWAVQTPNQDEQALQIINDYLQKDSVDAEAYAIQQKVLAKTRQKTEDLLKRLETLEQSH